MIEETSQLDFANRTSIPFKISADSATLSSRAVPGRILSDPSFIHRMACGLVSHIGGNPNAIAVIVETPMCEPHVECDEISRFPAFAGQPARFELLRQRIGVVAEPAWKRPSTFHFHFLNLLGIVLA